MCKRRLFAQTYCNIRIFKMRYFTYSDLTSVDEGGDMQIRRWGTQIDNEKVDQRRWEEGRIKRLIKGRGGEIAEERAQGRDEGRIEIRRAISSLCSTRKVFRLFHEVAYFRSLLPPAGIIEIRER